MKSLAKKFAPPTRAQLALVDAALAIQAAPDAAEKAFMARQLVLCTLPHTDPGKIPLWQRRNGNFILSISPQIDKAKYSQLHEKAELAGVPFDEDKAAKDCRIGYPYGVIPRLLLFWLVREALRNKALAAEKKVENPRIIQLGRSLSHFMRELGLIPSSEGAGKRSDAKRLREQMRRLFRALISFDDPRTANRDRWLDMEVAPLGDFWWDPKQPDQDILFGSWIELGDKFFDAITATPVPLDMRALKALKRSPLALDLYAWLCYSAFIIVQKKQPPQFVSWEQLRRHFGADYTDPKNFKKKTRAALRKIAGDGKGKAGVYPGLVIGDAKGGFTIHATRLAMPQKDSAKLPA